MSIVIQPSTNFTVVRQLADHTDNTTYYVQAVIRNALTDVIIATLDLTDKGSQRFKKDWHTVADPSGQGFYISIVTSVYTDSGFTTKSANYGDEESTHLIQERVLGSLKSGGGGLGMRDMRRLLQEELPKIKLPEKKEGLRIDTLISNINTIKEMLGNIPTDIISLSPLVSRLNEIEQAIRIKPVTPVTNLKPITDAIKEASIDREVNQRKLKEVLKASEFRLNEGMEERVIKAVTKATPDAIKGATFNIPMQLKLEDKKTKAEDLLDVNKLAI